MIIEDIKEGYKKTKLGWIPEDWETTTLEEVTIGKGQYGANEPAVEYSRELPTYLRITDINEDGSYNEDGKMSVNLNNYHQYLLKVDDIVFARTGGTVGRTYLHRKDSLSFVFAGFLIRYSINKDLVDPVFLKSYLQSSFYWKWVKINSVRSGQPGINEKEYGRLLIPYPVVMEQKAIANCLSTWDKAIEKQEVLLKAKQQVKQGLMQQLLSGKKRLPGFTEEWKEKRLDYFFSERKETNHLDLPLLSIGEAGVYYQNGSNKKDTSNVDKAKYKRICIGDIGYNTMRMWQGRSALSSLEGIVSPAYTVLKPKKNTNSLFFSYLFKTSPIIHRFYRNSQGLVSDTLNCKFKDFSIIRLVLPTSIEEQKAIAKVLNTADKEIEVLTNQLHKLKEQKKGLMQQLLTGKKRLKF